MIASALFKEEDNYKLSGVPSGIANSAQRGDWTTFNYQLPDNSSVGIIEISDVTGTVIERFTVTGREGQKVWDTRKTKAGVYFYTLSVMGNNKSGKIVIYK